jgi:transcription elongation factor Elf1
MADFRLSSFLHHFDCPHCQQPTHYSSPGDTILFASIKCEQCGRDLVIVQNKLWVHDQGSKSHPAQ